MDKSRLPLLAAILLLMISVSLGQPTKESSEESGRKCEPCKPGWGMVEPCYDNVPTLCKACPHGTYSPQHPHHKPCTPCSRCGKGLYVDKKCSSIHDTVCDTCQTSQGRFNEDYIRKCILSGELEKLAYKDYADQFPIDDLNLDLFNDPKKERKEPEPPLFLTESDFNWAKFLTGSDEAQDLPIADFADMLDDDPHHQFREWDGTNYVTHKPVPFYPARPDSYPYTVTSALAAQRYKLYVLVAVASVVLLCTLSVAVLLILFWRRRVRGQTTWGYGGSPRSSGKYSYLQNHLREQDLLLISDCAARLEKPSPDRKLRQISENVHAFENPMERLIEEEDDSSRTVNA